MLSLVSSCGSNLFRSLNLAPDPLNSLTTLEKMDYILKNAKIGDTTSFDQVISYGAKVKSDPSATVADIQQANYYISVAQMAKSGNSVIDILGKLGDVATGKIDRTIFAELQNSVTGNVRPAADSLNVWASTATIANDPHYEDHQLTRSVANSMATLNVINTYYILDETTGRIKTPVDSSSNPKDRVKGLVDSGLADYAGSTYDAAGHVSSLSSSDLNLIKQFDANATEVGKMSSALQGGAPYTGTTIDGQTVTLDSNTSPTDPNIEGVLNKLLQVK